MENNEILESAILERLENDLDCLITTYLTLWMNLKDIPESEEIEILEKLLLKMQLNLFSLSVLLKGSKYKNLDNIFDIPSIFTLSRTLIENYLTIEYLFVIKDEDLKHTTREERIKSYKFAGYKNCKQIANILKDFKFEKEFADILEKLELEIDVILEKLENIKKKDFGKPRMGCNWNYLIGKSKLNTKLYKSRWKFFSNYAHSEYMFNKGINEYISNPNALVARKMCYNVASVIISQLIVIILELFPEILKDKYKEFEIEKRNLVSAYNMLNDK
jgi:hypothetical protein